VLFKPGEKMVKKRTTKLRKEIDERKRAEEALRQSEWELRIRNRIAEIFLTSPDDDMYKEVLQVILKAMKSKYGTFGYFDPGRSGAFVCSSMTGDIWEKCRVKNKGVIFERGTWKGIWGRAVKEKKSLYSNKGPFNIPKGHIPIKNSMVVPVIYKKNIISAIHIADKETNYDEKDLELLETIANNIAPVLHARLQRKMEEKERRRAEEKVLEETYLSQTLLDNMPCVALLIKPYQRKIVACNEAALKAGAVKGKQCFATWGKSDEPCPWCHADEVWQTNEARNIDLKTADIAWDVHWVPVTEDLYLHYAFNITEHKKTERELHRHRQRLEGLVEERTTELTKTNKLLMEEIAEHERTEKKLRIHRKRLRSLASELSLAEEKERRRIAVGLHDDIGQILYITKMKLEEMLELEFSDDIGESLKEIIENIEHTIQRTGTLTFELSSPILYELGFEAALEMLAEKVYEQYGISSFYEDDNIPKPLDNEARILLYQSVRELLANIVKHAEARNIIISVGKEGDNIRININDDGVGFDISKTNYRAGGNGGFGLFSIRERLAHLGGRVEFDSTCGSGTRVSLVTPLKIDKDEKRRN
jgi:signal transduction histidine kinase